MDSTRIVYKNYNNLPITRYHFKTLDSTQKYCRENYFQLLTNMKEWAVVTATTQTSAIGTRNIGTDSYKKWECPVGNVAATYVVPWEKSKLGLLRNFAQVSCIATYQSILELSESFGIKNKIESLLKFKWVNDVLIDDKKVSGTLCEYIGDFNEDYACILIGTGINIWLPENLVISQPSTNLEYEFRKILSLNQLTTYPSVGEHMIETEILTGILSNQIYTVFNQFKVLNGFHLHLDFVNKRMAFIDTEVNIDVGNDIVNGVFKGLNIEGEALIQQEDGSQKSISSGTLLKNHKKVASYRAH